MRVLAFMLTFCSSYTTGRKEQGVKEQMDFPCRQPVHINSTFVTKTTFDEKFRVMFVMGLEGSGHHSFPSAFNACKKDDKHDENICVVDTELTSLMMKGKEKPKGIFVYGNQNGEEIECDRFKFVQKLKALKQNSGTTLIFLNGIARKLGIPKNFAAMVSYPSFRGDDKTLHHPDIQVLAALCEMAGVDLRIVVVNRNPNAIVDSTVMNRDLTQHGNTIQHHENTIQHPLAYEVAVLADNAAVMALQLQTVDPRFFMCVEYESMFSWPVLGPFLHPALDSTILAASFKTSHHSNPSPAVETLCPLRGHFSLTVRILQDTCTRLKR